MPAVHLRDVTMLEAVEALRNRDVYVQFERERLSAEEVDRSRPIVDARRRFSADVLTTPPGEQDVRTVVAADPAYDYVRLTGTPESFFVFPRSDSADRFGGSVLNWRAPAFSVDGASLASVVANRLGLSEHGIDVFDRGGILDRIAAPELRDREGLVYQILGELFARTGKRITWTVGGIGPARTLVIGMLPPQS